MTRRKRGVTLIELTVAMFIAVFILAAVVDLFFQSRRNYERPRASMSIQEDTMHLVRFLQQDLSETNVGTIRSFPNATHPNEPPGLSLESPRSLGGPISLGAGPQVTGAVVWASYVYYTLVPVQGSNPPVGHLVRREGPLTDQPDPAGGSAAVPCASALAPSSASTSQQRTIASNILLDINVASSVAGGFNSNQFLHSGFEVFFVDSNGLQRPFDDVPPPGAAPDTATAGTGMAHPVRQRPGHRQAHLGDVSHAGCSPQLGVTTSTGWRRLGTAFLVFHGTVLLYCNLPRDSRVPPHDPGLAVMAPLEQALLSVRQHLDNAPFNAYVATLQLNQRWTTFAPIPATKPCWLSIVGRDAGQHDVTLWSNVTTDPRHATTWYGAREKFLENAQSPDNKSARFLLTTHYVPDYRFITGQDPANVLMIQHAWDGDRMHDSVLYTLSP